MVLKCLRKDPSDRHGTAEALAQDLRRFVRGDPVEERPEARLDRLLRRWRRHRLRLALGACAFVLLSVTAVLFFKFQAAERIRAGAEYRAAGEERRVPARG